MSLFLIFNTEITEIYKQRFILHSCR